MSFCTRCSYSQNTDDSKFCIKCGQPILLKDRYRALSLLGEGGFGRTLLAIDEDIPSHPQCVIKQFTFHQKNPGSFTKAAELFRQEAVRLDDLRHPQIPQLLASFEDKNQLYLVQELIIGETLAQELNREGLFNEAKIRKILQEVLPVLQFIHDHQIIHRDIKPENIMRKSPGGNLIVIDFGIAKSIAMNAWMKTGTVTGSPEYMPPEQMRGKVLPASDIYSLGVTCVYLLTGISPFELFDDTSDRWVWRDFLPADHNVTNQLANILDKMIQNAISQRYQTAEEVLTAIKITNSSIKKPPVSSAVGLDYSKLRNFLATKQWQKADEETWLLMCLALSKKAGNYLSSSDIEKLPCEDFQIIDGLWTKYSQGHFGFSIQAQIYNDFNGDYGRFCAAVGWYLPYSITQNIKLTFSLSAPQGHLPSHLWFSGTQVGRQMKVLTAKVASCYN